jgi:hypothetical protein
METRLETTLEGNRWYDLKRWGMLSEVINDYLHREKLPQYAGVAYTDAYEYLDMSKFYTENPDLLMAAPVQEGRRRTSVATSESGLYNVDFKDPLPAQLFNNPKGIKH